jgi:DNA repair protein RadC
MDCRERALNAGLETLTDHDLLTLVLGTGSSGEPVGVVALSLLESEGGLSGLLRVTPHALARRRGIGLVKAVRMAAAFELGKRAQMHALATAPACMRGHTEVIQWARPRLATLDHEEVWLLALDARYSLKSARRVSQGGAHGCALSARDVLSPALRDAASAIVLVHNHPSGDPTPSTEDIAMTRALAAACEVVGIALVDHVVVARGGASSLFELGAF